MTATDEPILELTEYVPRLLPRDSMPDHVGHLLWRKYGSQVSVEVPAWKTDGHWQLTAHGWVGSIP